MSRKLMSLVALLIALYLLLCGALFIFQRSLIYFPQPDNAVTTEDSRLKLAMSQLANFCSRREPTLPCLPQENHRFMKRPCVVISNS